MSPAWLQWVSGKCCPLQYYNNVNDTSVVCSFMFWDVIQNLCVADGMPHICPWQMVKLLDGIHKLMNNVADVMPHCGKVLHPAPHIDKGILYLVSYVCPSYPKTNGAYLYSMPAGGGPWSTCRYWLNLVWYKSSSRCPIDNHGLGTLRLGRGGRGSYMIYCT